MTGISLSLIALTLGAIPALIIKKKGRGTFSIVGWWIFGVLLWPIALTSAILADPLNAKRCPDCAEFVRKEARKCRFCGHGFEGLKTCPGCRKQVPREAESCPFCRKTLTR